ncbi:MAG: putative sporulation protein YtxC [Firmicutes bacterium]|nr:putative sporulation protein YtxC [Bacillota bacterium]
MLEVAVITTPLLEDLHKNLLQKGTSLRGGSDIVTDIEIRTEPGPPAVCCRLLDPGGSGSKGDVIRAFRKVVASALTEVVLGKHTEQLIEQFLQSDYAFFSDEDRRVIVRQARRLVGMVGDAAGTCRRELIQRAFYDYLCRSGQLILDGFVRFRLKGYVGELRKAVERSVDCFLIEKEQKEFIRLLRYFVEVQHSRIDRIHVVFSPSGEGRLLNDEQKAVGEETFDLLLGSTFEREMTLDDALLSRLIALSPGQVILHTRDHNGGTLAETIRMVFFDRVKECAGCPVCNPRPLLKSEAKPRVRELHGTRNKGR